MAESYRAHCSNLCCWIPTESTNSSAFFGAAGSPMQSKTSVVCEGALCHKPRLWTQAANSSCSARPLLLDDQLRSPRKEDKEQSSPQ